MDMCCSFVPRRDLSRVYKRVCLKMLEMCLFVVWLIAGTIACRLPKVANEFIDFLFVPATKKQSHLV